MDTAAYLELVKENIGSLEEFYRKRESIDGEILKTEQLLLAAANMLPDEQKEIVVKLIESFQSLHRTRDAGLTEAIRNALKKTRGEWLTVTNVRDRLVRVGFNFALYTSNPLASISAVLRRLKEEEVETSTVDGSVTAYRWKKTRQGPMSLEALQKALAMPKGKDNK